MPLAVAVPPSELLLAVANFDVGRMVLLSWLRSWNAGGGDMMGVIGGGDSLSSYCLIGKKPGRSLSMADNCGSIGHLTLRISLREMSASNLLVLLLFGCSKLLLYFWNEFWAAAVAAVVVVNIVSRFEYGSRTCTQPDLFK